MSASVRISRRTAQAIYKELTQRKGWLSPTAINELREAMKPKPKKAWATSKKVKAERKTRKREKWSSVRAAVMARAGQVCECGCGRWFRGFGGAATPDHFFGRARAESVDTCWMLRLDCHEQKSLNQPSAADWFQKFITHCERHGYEEAAAKAIKEALWREAREGAGR